MESGCLPRIALKNQPRRSVNSHHLLKISKCKELNCRLAYSMGPIFLGLFADKCHFNMLSRVSNRKRLD